MVTVTVSSKGQIVIPKELREKYGLDQGTKVAVLEYPNEIVVVPLPGDTVKESRGLFSSKKPIRKMLAEARKEEKRLEKPRRKRKVS